MGPRPPWPPFKSAQLENKLSVHIYHIYVAVYIVHETSSDQCRYQGFLCKPDAQLIVNWAVSACQICTMYTTVFVR